MAEWLRRGLQILVRGFDSLRGLQADQPFRLGLPQALLLGWTFGALMAAAINPGLMKARMPAEAIFIMTNARRSIPRLRAGSPKHIFTVLPRATKAREGSYSLGAGAGRRDIPMIASVMPMGVPSFVEAGMVLGAKPPLNPMRGANSPTRRPPHAPPPFRLAQGCRSFLQAAGS